MVRTIRRRSEYAGYGFREVHYAEIMISWHELVIGFMKDNVQRL